MCGWVGLAPRLIVGGGDDFILMHHHGTDQTSSAFGGINRQIIGVRQSRGPFRVRKDRVLGKGSYSCKNQTEAIERSVGKGLFLACVMRVILFK